MSRIAYIELSFVVSLDTICVNCGMFSVDKVAKLLFDVLPLSNPLPCMRMYTCGEGIVGTLRG